MCSVLFFYFFLYTVKLYFFIILDILGLITGVTEVENYYIQSQRRTALRRCITVTDTRFDHHSNIFAFFFLSFYYFTSYMSSYLLKTILGSNYELKIYLWGRKATEFDETYIREVGQEEPLVAIFVGLLVKPFQGIEKTKLV